MAIASKQSPEPKAASASRFPGGLRSGSQFLDALRSDGRRVYHDGEIVSDVTSHPAFREGARSIARLYDVASDPAHREVMTYPSPRTGQPVNRIWQIPYSLEDLELRRPYKGVLEISHPAGRLFKRLEALFWDPNRRRHIEQLLATELASALEMEIADYEVLLDIPRPEKWEMDVWVTFAHPPVGLSPLVTWVQATGLQPDDLARYEQHQRRIRVVANERLRARLPARRDDLLLPTLERLVEM